MWYPAGEVLDRGVYRSIFGVVFAKILDFKHTLQRVVKENFSPPYSSLLAAFTLGDQSQMSDELKQRLNITGLRHIVAISGQHIIILTNMLIPFLLALGFWRRHAVLVSTGLMVVFIVLTGAETSAVRSGIMGGFYSWANIWEECM